MSRIGTIIVFVVVALLVGSTMIFRVDERQIGVVYAFSEVKRIINAPGEKGPDAGAGLYFKLPPPFETVAYIDKRIQTLEDANPIEMRTSENMGLIIDWFVKWRVVDAKTFIQSNNGTNLRTAGNTLLTNVTQIIRQEVAGRTIQQVLDSERQEIMRAVLKELEPIAAQMGIQIEDVRMRRVDYTSSTAPKIFQQMITEREIIENRLKAEGNARKEELRANADRDYQETVAAAYQRAQDIMGDGDAQATRIYAQAFGNDPKFAEFYRSLQAYRNSFKDKSDIMLVDPNGEFFKYMRSPLPEKNSSPQVTEAMP